jgi:hypothetical protein
MIPPTSFIALFLPSPVNKHMLISPAVFLPSPVNKHMPISPAIAPQKSPMRIAHASKIAFVPVEPPLASLMMNFHDGEFHHDGEFRSKDRQRWGIPIKRPSTMGNSNRMNFHDGECYHDLAVFSRCLKFTTISDLRNFQDGECYHDVEPRCGTTMWKFFHDGLKLPHRNIKPRFPRWGVLPRGFFHNGLNHSFPRWGVLPRCGGFSTMV